MCKNGILCAEQISIYIVMIFNLLKRKGGDKLVRRSREPFNGKRYIGNNSPNIENREVHDLDNEDPNPNGCQIDEIKNVKTFTPDKLQQALAEDFDPCDKCLKCSKR